MARVSRRRPESSGSFTLGEPWGGLSLGGHGSLKTALGVSVLCCWLQHVEPWLSFSLVATKAWDLLDRPWDNILCEKSRGYVIRMNFSILFLLIFPYFTPWDWSGGSPCCALMLDHDGTWWGDLQQGFTLMAPPARWLQSTDQFSVLCVRSACNLNGACSQLVLPFPCPPPPHAHIFPTDPFHASLFL